MNDELAWAGPAAALFRSLGNSIRLQVLSLLKSGEMSRSQIQERLGVTTIVLQQQLARLLRHHLLTVRRDSRALYYALSDRRPAKELEPVVRAFRDN